MTAGRFPTVPTDADDLAEHWTGRFIDDYIRGLAGTSGGRLAGVDGVRSLTYRELDDEIRRMAGGLQRRGIGPGDVVSWQLPNWLEGIVVHYAALRIGAVSNPIVPIYRAREVEFILRQAESRIFVVPRAFRQFAYPEMVTSIRDELPALEQVVVVRGDSPNCIRYDEMIAGRGPGGVERTPFDPAILMYTSGTTADPKGVVHPHVTLDFEIRSIMNLFRLTADDPVFMPSPITHITGLLYGMHLPFLLGSPTVLLDIWDAKPALELIERHRCAFTIAATPFLYAVTFEETLAERDVSSLRVFACGGADVPPQLVQKAEKRLGCVVPRIYGSTEFPTATSSNGSDPFDKRAGTDGRPITPAEVKVVDDDGTALLPGEEGEVLVRGPERFWGYLVTPEGEKSVAEGGWFPTGDLGFLDEDGYLTIRGRKKDIILRGGENISVKEVEDLLFTHPAVREVAIVAMPDPIMVERGCAFVVPEPGAQPSLQELTQFLVAKDLAMQKLPERLELIEALPKNLSGKVQKFRLRELAREFASPPPARPSVV